MAKSCSRPQSAKIALGLGGFFVVVLFVCLVTGGTIFIQEHYKVSRYVKDSCRVRSASYETIWSCGQNGRGGSTSDKCYAPIWQVEFGQNGTRKGTIRGEAGRSFDYTMIASDKYTVDSSYPCWYNTKKSSELTWYMPTTFPSLILLIIGAIAVPFAIISFVVYCRLREHADL